MQQTLIIQLLQTLSENEFQKFDKLIRSPYFHSHKDTIRLFEILKPYYPNFSDEYISKEHIYSQLFPDQPYEDSQLRTLRKYLLRLILTFLAIQRFQEDTIMSQIYLLDDLIIRDVHTLFHKQLRETKNLLKKEKAHDEYYLLKNFLTERYVLEYQFIYNKREKSPDLKDAHQHLDYYYLAAKLELICSELNNNLVVRKGTTDTFLSEQIFEYLDKHISSFPLLIQAYFYAATFLKNPETASQAYEQFKTVIEAKDHTFAQHDHTQLYLYAIGYANFHYRAGKQEYLKELFSIYQAMLHRDLLFEGSFFPVHNYKNLVTLGLRLEEYKWTENFIHTYKEFVPEQYREGIFKYNLAHLYFYQKKYGEALRLLQEVEFLDTFYQLGCKMLQLKIYYELCDTESFFSLAKTFQTHISRQKDIPDSRQEAYQHFVGELRKIFRIKIQEKANLQEIRKHLSEIHPIIEKEWLQKKVDELA